MKMDKFTHRLGGRLAAATGLALLTAVSARADYQGLVLGDTPVAYYALNPGADGTSTAPDLSGNSNDGVAVNISAAAGPTAYVTNAANFNGGAAIDLSQGANASMLNFSGPITLEAWAQPSSSSLFGDIVAKGYDSSTYQEIVLRVNGPYGANFYGSSGSAGETGGVQTTNWTHIVLSSDGTNCTLYANGVQVAQSGDPSGSQTFNDDWVIGNGSSGGISRTFNGNISQVAIYTHGLSASQVLAHYYMAMINAMPSNSVPIINIQPVAQQSYVGGSVTFSVATVSALATTNQWYKGGTPLSGQTGTSLTLNNLQQSSAGNYSVVIGNANGTTNSVSVALTVSVPRNLQWAQSGNSGTWDNSSSANWINLANSSQVTFNPGDTTLFDDTAGEPTTVNVSGTVVPSLITVNSSANAFTMSGGSISGSGSLVKEGTSTLTITTSGGITGTAIIGGGVMYAGNNCLSAASSIVISNNSTLDIGGGTFNNGKPVTVSGRGFNGEGAIYNSYGDYPQESMNLVMAGDTTFGGSQRWDMGNGASISGPYNLTVDWSGGAGYGQWNGVSIGANVAGITVVNGGTLGMTGMDSACQNPATLLTIDSGCTLTYYGGSFNGSLHLLQGATANLYGAPAAFNGSTITLEDSTTWLSYYTSGVQPINSAIILNGVVHMIIGDHNMLYTNLVSGPGGFVADYYNHDVVFASANTYTGPTIIGSGGNSPAVALSGNGSISASSMIFFGGSDPSMVRMDASGRSDNTFTLASGQTLGGIGAISGNFVAAAGSVVSPAGTNVTIGITAGSSPVGEITASGGVTLAGNTLLKLDGGSNDVVAAGGSITYGGTLSLTDISGAGFSAGQTFQLFNAATYNGSFTSIVPSSPGAGLAWSTTQLSSGKLSVVASTQPVISSSRVANGNFILSGSGGTASGTYYVLTTTNLTTPLASWAPAATNAYDSSGNFAATNAISAGAHQQFYLIKQ